MRTQTENMNPAPLSAEVYADIKNFIFGNIDVFRKDAQEYEYLDLTIACDEAGESWNYQTGDNSFTGGAYGLPHWAVTSIQPDSDPLEVYTDVIDQLENLVGSW